MRWFPNAITFRCSDVSLTYSSVRMWFISIHFTSLKKTIVFIFVSSNGNNHFSCFFPYRPRTKYEGRLCFQSVHTRGISHLHLIILPLVPCPLQGLLQWLVPGPFLGGTPVPGGGTSVPGGIPQDGYPQSGQDWVPPGQDRIGYPLDRSGWGIPQPWLGCTPPARSGWGTPRTGYIWTGYASCGFPQDCLVWNIFYLLKPRLYSCINLHENFIRSIVGLGM